MVKRENMNRTDKINEFINISKKEAKVVQIEINFFPKPIKGETKGDLNNANNFLKDITNTPHFFVLACVMDMGISAEYAWIIPYKIFKAFIEQGFVKDYSFEGLSKVEYEKYEYVFTEYYGKKLHRYNYMVKRFFDAVIHIKEKYQNNAANIWKDEPSSKTVVQRFREFNGVGQKISTMAANILARDFKVKYSDYKNVDISLDIQVIRVMKKLGFVKFDEDEELFKASIVLKCREMYPEYPGIFDYALWKAGREYCSNINPKCNVCFFNKICDFAERKF